MSTTEIMIRAMARIAYNFAALPALLALCIAGAIMMYRKVRS